mgnify:CR=1 FL=1
MTAKNRPRRISEATKTYNVLFPVALLETIHREADLRETSSAQLVRTAIEEYLLGNTQEKSEPTGDDYERGVADTLEKVRKVSRLRMKMATGQTMGDMVVADIERLQN